MDDGYAVTLQDVHLSLREILRYGLGEDVAVQRATVVMVASTPRTGSGGVTGCNLACFWRSANGGASNYSPN